MLEGVRRGKHTTCQRYQPALLTVSVFDFRRHQDYINCHVCQDVSKHYFENTYRKVTHVDKMVEIAARIVRARRIILNAHTFSTTTSSTTTSSNLLSESVIPKDVMRT